MKTIVTALLLATFSSTALAEQASSVSPRKYICEKVGGTEEWVIYIDLEKSRAGFFDDDTTVVVPLVETQLHKTAPGKTSYYFQGSDSFGNPGDIIRIAFHQPSLTASVTFEYGKPTASTLPAEHACVASPTINLDQNN